MHVCMVHVSMMRSFSVTNGRTNEPSNKAIQGVGFPKYLKTDFVNISSNSSSFSAVCDNKEMEAMVPTSGYLTHSAEPAHSFTVKSNF